MSTTTTTAHSLPTSTPSITTVTTSTPTPEFLDRFISAIASAFHSVALTTTFICEIDSASLASPVSRPSPPIPHARRVRHFAPGIRDSVAHPPSQSHRNAILAVASAKTSTSVKTSTSAKNSDNDIDDDDWAALASWEPPSYAGPAFSEAKPNDPSCPVRAEWRAAAARMRARYVGYDDAVADADADDDDGPQTETEMAPNVNAAASDNPNPNPSPETRTQQPPPPQLRKKLRPHYHLSFLARVPGREAVQGAISAVMLPFLSQARQQGVPVWLEAVSPHAVGVYEHYGFRVCEEVTVGVGKVGADGWPRDGGEGVKAWGMLWDGGKGGS